MELVRSNLSVNNYDMIRRPEFIWKIKNVQLCIDLESRALVTNPTRENVRHDRQMFFGEKYLNLIEIELTSNLFIMSFSTQ